MISGLLLWFAEPLGAMRNADAPTALEAQNRRAPILAHVRLHPRPCGSLLVPHVLLEVFADAPSQRSRAFKGSE